jgi:proline dehydrogenase
MTIYPATFAADLSYRMPLNFNDTAIAFQYRSNKQLKRARFLFSSMSSPTLTSIGMGLTKLAISWGLPVKGLVKRTIFEQFCGGETIEEAAATANAIAKFGAGIILDYSVEGKQEEPEFDRAVQEFIKAIQFAASQRKSIPFISVKITGFARFGLLELLHSGKSLSKEEAEEWARVRQRVLDICVVAAASKIMVLIDAEESWIQAPVDELADAMMARFNETKPIIFNTFQMYRHDRLDFLKISAEKAAREGYILGAKLVRGAYMEKERTRAEEQGYPSPIQAGKTNTDKDYDAGVLYCLARLEKVAVFIGTHNEDSCLKAAHYMEQHNIPATHPHVWFSQLYGMSDNISFNLAHAGYQVAKYLPYGPVKDVVPYLMRRAQENTSVAGQTGRELGLINKELKRRGL